MGDVLSYEGQSVWLTGAENSALRSLRHKPGCADALALYLVVRQDHNLVTKSWDTYIKSLIPLLGLKGEAGRSAVRRAIRDLESSGLVVKRDKGGRDGIVLMTPLSPDYVKDGDRLTTASLTRSATAKLTASIHSQLIDLQEDLEGVNDGRDREFDQVCDAVNNRQATAFTSIIKNNNKKTRTRSSCNSDFETVARSSSGQVDVMEDDQGRSSGLDQQPTDFKKIPAKTGVRMQQGTQFASESVTQGDSDTEAPPGGRESDTEAPCHTQGPPTEAAGGVLTDLTQGIWNLAQYFLRKPGMGDTMPFRLQNGKFNAVFRAWLAGGLTVAEIIEVCELNDKLKGQVGYSPNWYNATVLQHIADKKNPPALSGGVGKVYGSHSQVKRHHDRNPRPSQRRVDMPQDFDNPDNRKM